jgi:glycosyltransferase involved in cell wall biosynthesis
MNVRAATIGKVDTIGENPRTERSAPSLGDYPRAFVEDGRPGAERRRTIDGLPLIAGSSSSPPLVSIITIVFNNRAHIERAMQSVVAQTYRNLEYIVVDGGSTDGTVDAIRSYADFVSYWHSARDGGIADAFNRGVALARGDMIGLVNADDWMSPDQVEMAVNALTETDAPFVFGDLIYHQAGGSAPVYRITGDPDYARKLWHRMPQVTHPTAMVRREVYERYGLFDPMWRIGMDYDWLCRLNFAGVRGTYRRDVLGHMSLGGVSDARWRQCLLEHRAIAVRYGAAPMLMAPLFAVRRWKIELRLLVERLVPAAISRRLRRVVNRSLSEA